MNNRISLLIVAASLTLGGCQSNPGGLSDEEFNSLPPDRRAELRMEQESLNEQRMMRVDEEMDHIKHNQKSSGINWQNEAEKDAAEAMRGKDLSGL